MIALSPYLIAVIAAWFVAQGIKFLIGGLKRHGKLDLRQLYTSGDMPSSHSAATIALMTVVAFRDGVNSPLFALSMLFAAIVMYDAVMVRRSTGEQGEAIQALIKEHKSAVNLPRSAKGHTPVEVFAGALLGAVIGLLVFSLT